MKACAYLLGHPALGAQAHTWLADAAMGETRLAWADRERIDAGSKSTGVAARQSSNVCLCASVRYCTLMTDLPL